MKKVLSLMAIFAMLLFVLTGCVNINYEVSLNTDGSADIAYVYAFEKATLEQMGTSSESMTKDMQEKSQESGYTIESYEDDTMAGFKASKHLDNVADASLAEAFGTENVKDTDENKIVIEKKGGKTLFSQNANIDLTGMDSSTASYVTMKYTVKLPVKAKTSNATEVSKDGKTLTWELKSGEENRVEFTAVKGGLKILPIIIVVAVIAIACAAFFVIKGAKKDKPAEVKKEAPAKEEKKEEPKKEAPAKEEKKEEPKKEAKKEDKKEDK